MAKKAQSTLPNMLVSLTAIALVAAAALAALNGVTKDPIEKAKQDKVNNAISKVLTQVNANGDTVKIEFATLCDTSVYLGEPDAKTGKYNDSVTFHLAYDAEGNYVGAAVESIDPDGFGGSLKIITGFDVNAVIYGYSILETHETPGLGAKADTWFQPGNKGNIIGHNLANLANKELKVKKDDGNVDAISGSTITSRAFLRGVNKAYSNLIALVGEKTTEVDKTDEKTVTNE